MRAAAAAAAAAAAVVTFEPVFSVVAVVVVVLVLVVVVLLFKWRFVAGGVRGLVQSICNLQRAKSERKRKNRKRK